jgi:peptide/nickel transport system permease protein
LGLGGRRGPARPPDRQTFGQELNTGRDRAASCGSVPAGTTSPGPPSRGELRLPEGWVPTVFGYIVRRLFAALLVLILTSMTVFAIFYLGPKNPAKPLCEKQQRCTPEKLERLERSMGLDKPVHVAYGDWAQGLFVGRTVQYSDTESYDCSAPCLGISYRNNREVTSELAERYPATLSLAIGGALIYLSVGVVAGVFAARYRGTFIDRALVTSTLVVSAIPYYLVALLAWIFLTQKYSFFPETTYNPFFSNPATWAGGLLLPWLVLGLTNATQYSRYTRGQMVETLGEDYIRTAVAKGQKERVVVFRHALRAAIIPVVTIFGLDFATLLGGTVFTEYIFDIEGMGRWALGAVIGVVDIPVVTATVLVAASFIVVSNLVVDVVYSFLDPRVRLA